MLASFGAGWTKCGFIQSYFNEKIMLNKQFNANTLTQKYIFDTCMYYLNDETILYIQNKVHNFYISTFT